MELAPSVYRVPAAADQTVRPAEGEGGRGWKIGFGMALEKSPFYFFTVSFKTWTDHDIDPSHKFTDSPSWLRSCLNKTFWLDQAPLLPYQKYCHFHNAVILLHSTGCMCKLWFESLIFVFQFSGFNPDLSFFFFLIQINGGWNLKIRTWSIRCCLVAHKHTCTISHSQMHTFTHSYTHTFELLMF